MTHGTLKAASTLLVLGSITLISAQGWAIEDLKERIEDRQERMEAMRQQVFLRLGSQMGYESADQLPLSDMELQALTQELAKVEPAAKSGQSAAQVQGGFAKAHRNYQEGRHDEAYTQLIEIYFQEPDNVPVAFFTGRSAFETKRYDVAAGAYQQVLTVNPDHHRARLELGRTYFVMGLHEQSRREFLRVEESPGLPDLVRQNIRAYLNSIDASQKRHHLSGQIAIGLGHDSNVNSGNDYILPALRESGVSEPGAKAKSDTLLNLMSFNSHRYDFGRSGGWQWQSDLLIFANRYADNSDLDLTLVGLKSGPFVDLPQGRITIPAAIDKVWLDGDGLMDIRSLALSIERPIAPQHFGKAQLRYLESTNAAQEDKDRDATGGELTLDWRYLSVDQSQMTNAGMLFINESPKSGKREGVEYSAYAFRGGHTWMGEGWSMGLTAQVRKADYKELYTDPIDESLTFEREDTQITLGAMGTKVLRPNLTLSSQLSWTDNDSSYELYDYTKTLLQVNLGWGWGI